MLISWFHILTCQIFLYHLTWCVDTECTVFCSKCTHLCVLYLCNQHNTWIRFNHLHWYSYYALCIAVWSTRVGFIVLPHRVVYFGICIQYWYICVHATLKSGIGKYIFHNYWLNVGHETANKNMMFTKFKLIRNKHLEIICVNEQIGCIYRVWLICEKRN